MVRGRFTVWRERERETERRSESAETRPDFGDIRSIRGQRSLRGLSLTHNVGRFATCLENVDGVVGVHVLHGNPVDHHNLVFGAADGRKHDCELIFVRGTQR